MSNRASVLASSAWARAAFIVATLSLLWPALVHGKPFLFADTSAYVRVVDAAVYKATGHASEWTRRGEVERLERHSSATSAAPKVQSPTTEQNQVDQNRVPLLGRSVYYGLLAYASATTGTFWLLALTQAAILAAVVLLLLTDLGGSGSRCLWAASLVLLVLAATSTAPFFTSFAMPDIFTGVAILAGAMLHFSPSKSRERTALWFLLASTAALFHSSNVLILALLAVLGAAILLLGRDRTWGRAGLVLAAALTGVVGEAIFAKGVDLALGSPPVRPPFVTARLVEDGPGLRYLREHCGTEKFYLCEFRDRLPHGSDSFLWSAKTSDGVFNTLDPAGKRRLADEQGRFVRNVVLAYPGDVILSSAGAVARQMGLMRLSEFRDIDLGQGDPTLVPASVSTGLHSPGKLAPLVGPFANLTLLVALLSLIALPFLVRKKLIDGRIAATIVAGVLFNAAICGALSTPHDRYGARVLWVLPLLAAASLSKLALSPRALSRWRQQSAAPQ